MSVTLPEQTNTNDNNNKTSNAENTNSSINRVNDEIFPKVSFDENPLKITELNSSSSDPYINNNIEDLFGSVLSTVQQQPRTDENFKEPDKNIESFKPNFQNLDSATTMVKPREISLDDTDQILSSKRNDTHDIRDLSSNSVVEIAQNNTEGLFEVTKPYQVNSNVVFVSPISEIPFEDEISKIQSPIDASVTKNHQILKGTSPEKIGISDNEVRNVPLTLASPETNGKKALSMFFILSLVVATIAILVWQGKFEQEISPEMRNRPIFKEFAKSTSHLSNKLGNAEIPVSGPILDLRSSCHTLRDTLKNHKKLDKYDNLVAYLDDLGELLFNAGDEISRLHVDGDSFLTSIQQHLVDLEDYIPIDAPLSCGKTIDSLSVLLKSIIWDFGKFETSLRSALKAIKNALNKYKQLGNITSNLNIRNRVEYVDTIQNGIKSLEEAVESVEELDKEVQFVRSKVIDDKKLLNYMCGYYVGDEQDQEALQETREQVIKDLEKFKEKMHVRNVVIPAASPSVSPVVKPRFGIFW
ncbi:4634_t:CDS:2 [Ambispora gerdemannii]|uniref:4634_t:CDS:1 n=1 Tax=Ambispora gerdemannii TaxID=144530 RepID=A0A9N9BRJ7_9GLOM|nr:4634_t:CDS:2 [Ambispora gerdemannii]